MQESTDKEENTVMLSCGQLKEGSLGHDQKNVHLGNMRVAKHLYQQGPQKEQQKVETKCGRSDRDLRGV